MKTYIKLLFKCMLLSFLFVACKTPKQVAYFQDVLDKDTLMTSGEIKSFAVRPGDKLLIIVSSSIPEMAAVFNLPVVGYRIGTNYNNSNLNNSQSTMSYIVGSDGNIDFPVLGKVKVDGLQRDSVASLIKNRLVNENLCNDAVVNVEIDNAYVNILGEVAKPGRYLLTNDCITIFDALSMAGDLAIQGYRNNILVARKTSEGTQIYKLDLTQMGQIVHSPAYYIQQGDVIYVEPNNYRKRQTTVNGNNVLSASFWISVTSLAATITTTVSVLLSNMGRTSGK
ncbi:MAG: polysaccharide biosynthesis/export family protein [Paludibacteraceae bacterium]|nr:polysaccharide biosynthesis/export family protein [Paludibacteraceae bacterium]